MRPEIPLRGVCLALLIAAADGALAAPAATDAEPPPTPAQLLEQGRLSMFGAQPQDALALFSRAAQAGSARALGAIGELHERGVGVARNAREAADWYRKALAAGDEESRARLGLLALSSAAATPKAMQEGLALVQAAAERGSAYGRYALARLLLEGLHLRRDEAKGLSLLEQAAREEVPEAQALLGQLYAEGREVSAAHPGMAVELSTLAARNGDVGAQARLGAFYRDGWGVERDSQEAAYWLAKAAEAGNTEAAAQLGLLLAEGAPDLRRDPAAGLDWLKAAAGRGSALAQYHLGVAMLEGRGLAQDAVNGLALVREAASRGLALAAKRIVQELGSQQALGVAAERGAPAQRVAQPGGRP